MLPARHRLRRSSDFRQAVRRGRRAGSPLLVVHLLPAAAGEPQDGPGRPVVAGARVTTAGLVVSRAVGGAVVRTRVRRRLRHLLAPRLAALPSGARLVVRANPPAAAATSAELEVDLDRALRSAQRVRSGSPPSTPPGRS